MADRMTLDEAIEHAEEQATACAVTSPACAEDHAQLAAWLRELRDRRSADAGATSNRGGA